MPKLDLPPSRSLQVQFAQASRCRFASRFAFRIAIKVGDRYRQE
jgi:hypothetical protein